MESERVEANLPKGWRCPECGAEVVALANGAFSPVTCNFGHPPVEMEQFLANTQEPAND